jgi:hypothetical protein
VADPRHPLAEVFGYPPDDFSDEAVRHRRLRLCPFNNKVPSCTKDRAQDPLGVCTVRDESGMAITCPVRFRQDWLIAEHAAAFFFPPDATWTSLTEVRLNDRHGKSAGNIDVVLVSYDANGQVTDFGALEVQAVYVSGNIRRPFAAYMEDPTTRYAMDWSRQRDYPRADYLSSSRKRLAPQLIYKGGILNAWGKKMAVAVHRNFYASLPALPEVAATQANLAWLVYDLEQGAPASQFALVRSHTAYTMFADALSRITNPDAGDMERFVRSLQRKLDEKMESTNPPDAPILSDPIEP